MVTPESARSDNFARFINRIRGQKRLDRIVIDKCHVVLNEQRDFRPQLQELGELGRAEVPMVMLTAILPPTVEEYFMKRMWMKADNIYMFRSYTTRSNIRYQIYRMQNYTVRAQEAELLEYIYQARAELYSSDKMVIYSNRVEDCKSLAESIRCEVYFHHADDTQRIFQRFAREERHNTIVTTSAFGMGIDIAHIRCVMYINEPRTLFDYSQKSGRAGRDGQSSRMVVIRGRMKGLIHEASDINIDRVLI